MFNQGDALPANQHCWSCTCYLKTKKAINRVEEKSIQKLIDKYTKEIEHIGNVIEKELKGAQFNYGIVKDFMISRATLHRILIDLKGLLYA